MDRKKILVTGSTGFIGNYVINELLKYKNVDIIATSRNIEKARDLDWYHKVKFIKYDLSEKKENLLQFFDNPTNIIHLSWEGLSFYKSRIHIENNLINNYEFLKKLVEEGIKDITCIGTCFEYGKQDGSLKESFITNPNTSYAIAKDTLRKFLEILNFDNSFSLKWVRLFYLYGEGQSDKSLFGQLDRAIKSKDKIFNMSKGEQLRDYLSVEEVAKNICLIALQNDVQGIINCGSGIPTSIRSLVEEKLLIENSNITLNLGYYDYPDYEPMSFWANIEKLNFIKNKLCKKE